MYLDRPTALFWDYENVPLRIDDYVEFLNAIDQIYKLLDIEFTRIYARKKTMSDGDYGLLRNREFDPEIHFKWVEDNKKNAVDKILIQSCLTVLKTRPHITQVIIIAGDGDFYQLVNNLPDHHIMVICQGHNYSKKLIETVDEGFSVEYIAQNKNWIRIHSE